MLRLRNIVKDLGRTPSEILKNIYCDTSAVKSKNILKMALEMFSPADLRIDYQINERDRGLMGDREIEILPGKNPEPADRSGPLRGEFVPGIAESIPLAEGLKTQIEELLALIHRMADTKNPASFVRQFNSAVGRIDSATGQLVTMVASIEHPVTQSLAQLDTIAGQARQLSSTVLRQAGRAFPKVDSLLAQSAAILTRIEPVVDSLAVLSHAALNDSTVVSQMLRPVSFLDTLNTMIRNLNRELADTRKTGRLNINLF